MEYFRLQMSRDVKNCIKIEVLDPAYYKVHCTAADFERIPKGLAAYYHYSDNLEIPDIIKEPTFMVSGRLKHVLMLYQEEIEEKAVKVFAFEERVQTAPAYWVLKLEEVPCLADRVKTNPNGTLEELILDRNKIGDRDVFRVQGTLEDFVIVSLSAAESILRRKLYGAGFEKVKVI